MTKSAKIITTIIVIILIGIGVWWYTNNKQLAVTTPTPSPTVTPTPAPVIQGILTTQPTDASDAALLNDLSAIDVQASFLASDAANIDSNMNASTESTY